jgi:GDP-L-fucose synthase
LALYSLKGKRVWVAGHRGMVGSAIVRRLASEDCEVLVAPRAEVDLRSQAQTSAWLEAKRPDAVVLAAARVGGILANASYPAEFLYDNLMIEGNVIEGSRRAGVQKLLLLGSSCIYPKFAEQPIPEEALLTGALEPTNEWYAIAKIAGVKLAQAYRSQYGCDFICAMPTNLYGPGDNFDLASGHVMPAIIRKAHEARQNGDREIVVWGSGTPRREFLHVDDCADACIHLLKTYSEAGHVNVGAGEDISILDLTRLICEIVGFAGGVRLDHSKPDGTPRKLLKTDKIRGLGWSPRIELRSGVASTYAWYQRNSAAAPAVGARAAGAAR